MTKAVKETITQYTLRHSSNEIKTRVGLHSLIKKLVLSK